MCHLAEYELAAAATVPPADGAWLDYSCIEHSAGGTTPSGKTSCGVEVASPDAGRGVAESSSGNCSGWTTDVQYSQGLRIDPYAADYAYCDVARAIACCVTPYRETFRGFTAVTTSGDAGGRAAMHAMCSTEFPGSHLCFAAEYQRAHPTSAPPIEGAWIDGAAYNDVYNDGVAMPRSGRTTGASTITNCDNWTSAAQYVQGLTVSTPEATNLYCEVARPLACCGG
jgi:hypothetical protein